MKSPQQSSKLVTKILEQVNYLEEANPYFFRFNYNGNTSLDPWGEVATKYNVIIKFGRTEHLLQYEIFENQNLQSLFIKRIEKPVFILLLSTTNSAHSISELISFISYYKLTQSKLPIAVSAYIKDALPFLYQLLEIFVGKSLILDLDPSKNYYFSEVILRRNTHMNFLTTWNKIDYQKNGSILTFNKLQNTTSEYLDDVSFIVEKAHEITSLNKRTENKFGHVMIVKRSTDTNSTTPGRAMVISEDISRYLENIGIKLLSVNDFDDINDYISTIYSAKTFIVSYGGAACTNRFFCNPDCHVILLANRHYKWEYDYPSDFGDFWHLRHSHLFTVEKQTVILDHNDEMTINDVDLIKSMI